MRVRACRLAYPACNAHGPYCIVVLTSLAPPYFSTFSHNSMYSGKKVTEHKVCVSIFSAILFETFLIIRRSPRDVINVFM